MTGYFDTHAHLQEPEFRDDLDATVERARAAGVTGMLVLGVDYETSVAAISLARRFDGVHAAAGFHPHEARRMSGADLEAIEAFCASGAVVAVGEIGLDYFYNHSPREDQLRVLESMLDLARRHRLPVAVHTRDAEGDMSPLLRSWSAGARAAYGLQPLGVMHYFSGTPDEAAAYVEMGFMISIHTSVTYSRSATLRQVAGAVPLDRMVIETDSPYGAPQAFRGKRNEPAYVVEAARAIAEARGIEVDQVAAATTANARRLLGLPAASAGGSTKAMAAI